MTIINHISRLENYGVFHDFTWPQGLPDFARYNLIYGWNGSGKTTLSRLFRSLENKTLPSARQAIVKVKGRDLTYSEFGQTDVPVRVFNRDFIEESVFPTNDDIAPIFILGEKNVEKQRQVEQLKIDRNKTNHDVESAKKDQSDTNKKYNDFCTNRGREISNSLLATGAQSYKNYDKRGFIARAEKMIDDDDQKTLVINDTAMDKLLAQLRANPKDRIKLLTYRLPDLKSIADVVSELLAKTVVSTAIQSLKDDTQLSPWIHTGLGLHQSRGGDKCLFCDQPMARERLAALEAHFSTEYKDLQHKLNEQIDAIQSAIQKGTDLKLPNAAELYDELSSEFDAATAVLCGERDAAKRVLETLAKALEDKKSRAFEQVKLDVVVPTLNGEAVTAFNQILLQHNTICDKFQTHIDTARKQLEAHHVASNLDEFIKLRNALKTTDDTIKITTEKRNQLDNEIAELEREIIEHRTPAEKLNTDLQSYLGHSELRLEIKATGYAIMRHDVPAVSLSEGEKTAIALLYFLKSLEDRRFNIRDGVVVLDDPVSSLDANALYSAFGFIRARTQSAAQLIILTHNFTFFRQVRNWFSHLRRNFYMLDCTYVQDRRYAGIKKLDPLLEEYESEYHYLFAHIGRTARDRSQSNLEQNYMLPNMARRLLEAFLAFRYPNSDELWRKMLLVKFEEAKKNRILRFVNTYSHNDVIGEPEHDLSLLREARSILNDILNLIKLEDPTHYSRMTQTIGIDDDADKNE